MGRPNWENTQLTLIGKGPLNGPYKVWLMPCPGSSKLKISEWPADIFLFKVNIEKYQSSVWNLLKAVKLMSSLKSFWYLSFLLNETRARGWMIWYEINIFFTTTLKSLIDVPPLINFYKRFHSGHSYSTPPVY